MHHSSGWIVKWRMLNVEDAFDDAGFDEEDDDLVGWGGGDPARLAARWHSKGAGMTLAGPEKDIFQSGSFLGKDLGKDFR